MKPSVAAIILFSSIATSFAGNLTPIPKNKIAQTACPDKRQSAFDLCIRLRGTSPSQPIVTPGTTPSTPPIVASPGPGIGPNCEMDRDLCLRSCQVNPRG